MEEEQGEKAPPSWEELVIPVNLSRDGGGGYLTAESMQSCIANQWNSRSGVKGKQENLTKKTKIIERGINQE